MEHQQWHPVVLKKTVKTVTPPKQLGNKFVNKLDTEDPDAPKILGKEAGNLLSKKRCEKGFTQKSLAQKLNITSNTVRDYENGNVVPEHNILLKICRELGIKMSEIKK